MEGININPDKITNNEVVIAFNNKDNQERYETGQNSYPTGTRSKKVEFEMGAATESTLHRQIDEHVKRFNAGLTKLEDINQEASLKFPGLLGKDPWKIVELSEPQRKELFYLNQRLTNAQDDLEYSQNDIQDLIDENELEIPLSDFISPRPQRIRDWDVEAPESLANDSPVGPTR